MFPLVADIQCPCQRIHLYSVHVRLFGLRDAILVELGCTHTSPSIERSVLMRMGIDSLICAYSPDASRCTCLEPDGPIVNVGFSKCRSLAERGSVLSQ